MPTLVTKSIGTSSRDYSTLQAWEDACPANLTTDDKVWRGECYNDGEFLFTSGGGTAILTIAGMTVDATRYLELTAATGQSFQDYTANVRTNALTYNQANGVGLRHTGAYGIGIDCQVSYTRISKLQIKMAAGNSQSGLYMVNGAPAAGQVTDMIVESSTGVSGLGAYVPIRLAGDSGAIPGCVAVNVLLVLRHAGAEGMHSVSNNTLINCGVVKLTDYTDSATWGAFQVNFNGTSLTNCYCFGMATVSNVTPSGGTNATDKASGFGGSGNVYNVTYTSTTPFTLATAASTDVRSIAATALAGAGTKDATNAPNDMTGLSRASACTIGPWEISAASDTLFAQAAM